MQTRGVVGVALTLVLLAGCTGAPQTPAPTGVASTSASAVPALVEGDHLNPDAMQAVASQFTALPPAAQEQELAAADLAIERQLWTLSGLEAKLGGAEKADAVFARANGEIRSNVAAIGSAIDPQFRIGRKGVILPTDALSDANGAALFSTLMLAKLMDSLPGDQVDGKAHPSVTKDGLTFGSTPTTGTVKLHTTGKSNGVEITINLESASQPCPDASGQVVASITASAATNLAGTGARFSYHVEVTIQVDDDARISGRSQTFRSEQSEYSPKGRRFVDIATGKDYTSTVKRSVGDVTDDFVAETARSGVQWGALLGVIAADAAEKKWLSGDCVNLKPTVSAGPSGVKPGSTVTIVAAPRAKSDGARTGGTVTAQLTGGEASVSPSGSKVPADATFTYVAPDAPHETGTVALESRSRRGVGKASITFSTDQLSFSASGGANDFHGTGTICDLKKPFVIAGSGLTMDFTPSSESSGTYDLTGNAGGVTWSGGGTYTVTVSTAGTSGRLVSRGVNRIRTPRGSYSGQVTAKFTLRSIAPCGG